MYAGGAGGNRDGVSGLRPQHFAGWGDELRQDQRRGGGARRLEVLQRGGERALERRGERETREPGLEGLQAAPVVPGRDGARREQPLRRAEDQPEREQAVALRAARRRTDQPDPTAFAGGRGPGPAPSGAPRPPPTRDELLGEAAVLRPAHDNGPVAAVAQLLDERAPVSDRPALGRVSRAGSQGREPGVREPTLHQPLRHTLRRAATEVELRGTAIGARVELSRRLEVTLRDRDAGAVGIELGGDEQGAGELALAVPRPAAADQQAQQGAAHAAVEVEPVRGGERRQAPGEVTDRLVGL